MATVKDVENLCIQRVDNAERYEFIDALAVESAATIVVNGKEIARMACSPSNLRYLAAGFLASEGMIGGREEIKRINVDEGQIPIRIKVIAEIRLPATELSSSTVEIASGCGKGIFFITHSTGILNRVQSDACVSFEQVFHLARAFHQLSGIYRDTGGVHSAAVSDGNELLLSMEDISRHHAVDKVVGACVLQGVPLAGRILLTSGRISSDLVLKAARVAVPIVISRSAPTTLAVKVACDLGVTLIGFARGRRMNVYSHAWRITGG